MGLAAAGGAEPSRGYIAVSCEIRHVVGRRRHHRRPRSPAPRRPGRGRGLGRARFDGAAARPVGAARAAGPDAGGRRGRPRPARRRAPGGRSRPRARGGARAAVRGRRRRCRGGTARPPGRVPPGRRARRAAARADGARPRAWGQSGGAGAPGRRPGRDRSVPHRSRHRHRGPGRHPLPPRHLRASAAGRDARADPALPAPAQHRLRR